MLDVDGGNILSVECFVGGVQDTLELAAIEVIAGNGARSNRLLESIGGIREEPACAHAKSKEGAQALVSARAVRALHSQVQRNSLSCGGRIASRRVRWCASHQGRNCFSNKARMGVRVGARVCGQPDRRYERGRLL